MSSITQIILPIGGSITTFVLSVGAFFYLTNTSCPRRTILSPLLYIPAGLSFATLNWWPGDLNSLWGLLLCIWVGHSTSLLFLEDERVWEDGDYLGRISNLAPHIPGKYYKAVKLWNNVRLLGTSYQCIIKTPTPATATLCRFTVLRLAKLVTYLGMYFYIKSHIFPAAFMPVHIDEFSPIYQVYFRRLILSSHIAPVTLRETLMRCAFVSWWAFTTVAMLDSAHGALSLVFVALLRFDEPSEWPPIFGSPNQAWNIRRFWSRFWHQIVRRSHTNYGKWVSRRIFRLQPRSLPDKVFVIFAIFFLSGMSHGAVSRQLGDRYGWKLDVWWFCANFGAGLLEVVGIRLVRVSLKRIGRESWIGRLEESGWSRSLGFVWVFSFLFWSIPKWQYPKLYCLLSGGGLG